MANFRAYHGHPARALDSIIGARVALSTPPMTRSAGAPGYPAVGVFHIRKRVPGSPCSLDRFPRATLTAEDTHLCVGEGTFCPRGYVILGVPLACPWKSIVLSLL